MQDGTKGVPSCPLKTYTRAEKLQARKIKKVIVKNSGSSEKIHFNVIYISTATKSEKQDCQPIATVNVKKLGKPEDGVVCSDPFGNRAEDNVEFCASEEPGKKNFVLLHIITRSFSVFVVKKCRRFVDRDGKAYANFKDYKENNNLPKGAMLAPQNGSYTPKDGDGRVPLELGETPAASPIKRIRAVADTVVMVGGIVLAVAGVVTFCAPAAFSAAAMAAIEAGSFALTTYSLVG